MSEDTGLDRILQDYSSGALANPFAASLTKNYESAEVSKACKRLGYSFEQMSGFVEQVILSSFSLCTKNTILSYINVNDRAEGAVPNLVVDACLDYLVDKGCLRQFESRGKKEYSPSFFRRFSFRGIASLFSEPDLPVGIGMIYKH